MIARAVVALALVGACSSPARGPRVTPRQVEVLLNDQLASAHQVGALAADFDVSPARLVVLSDAAHLYALGWGGIEPLGDEAGVDSFAFTPDGLLLAVRGDQLLYAGETGALELFFTLPHAGMALATGTDVVYLFDRANPDGVYGLYELQPGRKIGKVLDAPQPIDAVAQDGQRLLFVSGGVVFEATPGQELRTIARLAESTIRSVAAEPGRVYFSDDQAVYSLADDGVVLITATAGGTLRVRDGALLVLDPARKLLLRLAPR